MRAFTVQVRELRDLFHAYLEQMQTMSGPEIELLVVQALEASDMLDGALSLQEVSEHHNTTHTLLASGFADVLCRSVRISHCHIDPSREGGMVRTGTAQCFKFPFFQSELPYRAFA